MWFLDGSDSVSALDDMWVTKTLINIRFAFESDPDQDDPDFWRVRSKSKTLVICIFKKA